MSKINNIADAIKYVDFVKYPIYIYKYYHLTKKEQDTIQAFIYACKSFCYDRGITISDPSETIDEEAMNEHIKQASEMVDDFVRKEAYSLAQYDSRSIDGWSIIRHIISIHTMMSM